MLRFRLDDPQRRMLSVERMSYHGDGGWLCLRSQATLAATCDCYVPMLGTEEMLDPF